MGRKFIVEEIIEPEKPKLGGCAMLFFTLVGMIAALISKCCSGDEESPEHPEQIIYEEVVDMAEVVEECPAVEEQTSDIQYDADGEIIEEVVEMVQDEPVQLVKEQSKEEVKMQIEESQSAEENVIEIVKDSEEEEVTAVKENTKTAREQRKAERKAKRKEK